MSMERRLLRKKKRMFAPPFRMNAAIGRRAAATSRKANWNESIALAASRTDISGIILRLRDIDRNCQYRVIQKTPRRGLNFTTGLRRPNGFRSHDRRPQPGASRVVRESGQTM